MDDRFEVRTLDELIARLAKHEAVRGILLMGTTGTAGLTPTSDYDLLVVFSALPVPLRMITTWVDDRLTETYCTTDAAVERVTKRPVSWPEGSEEGTLVTWLQEGRIVHDPTGRLTRAQERARRGPPPTPATNNEIAETRRTIAYNVAQLQRYLAADDRVSAAVVDLRLLYSLFEVVLHYFTVRRLPWRGEKAAVRYWVEHDPAFLDVLRHCLASDDRQRKAVLYVELAQRALAPVGGLWARAEPIIALGRPWAAGAEEKPCGTTEDVLRFSQTLLDDDPS